MGDETLLRKTLFTVHSHRDLFLCDEHNADFFVKAELQTYAADYDSALARDVDDDLGQEQDVTPATLPEMLPFLRVTTDHEPIDARIGFDFGSDPAVSDVLLDKDPTQGISKKQFAIQRKHYVFGCVTIPTSRQSWSGAYGVVYEAVHQVTGDVVAVKQLGKDKEMRLEEAMLLRSITHEHIVKFHAFIIESDSLLLVMEFVHGLNLEQEFKADCPSLTELREVIRQQLNATEFIHHRGIVHRDIKPPNVMVKSRHPMVTKLTDFGLAIRLPELADEAPRCGTAPYTAPEILERKVYDEKVDIWSLGIILLRYFHELPPFPKVSKGPTGWGPWRNWPDKVRHHVQSMPLSPTSRFISTLLTSNPTARPSAKEALRYPFFSAELSIYSTEETANAALPGDDLVDEDTIRASSHRQGPQEISSWGQRNNLLDTEIPRYATTVLGNETGSNPPERHTKRQKNGQDPSLSEVARFLESIDDPLESRLFGSANQRATSERVESKVSGRGSYEETSELPSLRWNAQEQRDLTRDASQNTPREDEEQDVSTHQYELNFPLNCPPGYKVMRYNERWIGYHPQLQRVNITSLLGLGNIDRSWGQQWIETKQCHKIIVKGIHHLQGTYITLDAATICCADLGAGLATTNALRVIRSGITDKKAQNNIGVGPPEPARHSPPPPCDPAPRFKVNVGGKIIRLQAKNHMVHAWDICRAGGTVPRNAVSMFLQNNPSIQREWVRGGPNRGYYINEEGANQLFKHFQLSSDLCRDLFREIANRYR
ncbi:hypothetical protein CcaCcLH18_11974 [Colletotrichum camelliae]|nr:hypothetical protein CcaCcLH18_11974 [Colletotrichum camelliae]